MKNLNYFFILVIILKYLKEKIQIFLYPFSGKPRKKFIKRQIKRLELKENNKKEKMEFWRSSTIVASATILRKDRDLAQSKRIGN